MYLSIVVLNYFSHEKIYELVSSINRQDFTGELVIVDNSENNDEYRKLQHCNNLMTRNECKVIQSDSNGGFSYGTNIGIKSISSATTHVYILNPDTVLKDNALEYISKVITALPDVIISPRGIRMDNKKNWSFGGRLHIFKGRCDVDATDKPYTISSNFGTCASVIVPVNFLNKYGLLDEDFFLGGEEWEQSVRMRRQGISILTPSEIIYEHEISGTHKKYGLPFLYMGHRTKVLFMRKCFPMFFPLWMLLYLPALPFLTMRYTINNKLSFLKSFSLILKAIVKSTQKKRITKDEFFKLGNIK